MPEKHAHHHNWRSEIFRIIYYADTPLGKWFDLLLIVFIVGSVLVIILDSVAQLNHLYGHLFKILEWFFTVVFTLELLLRLISIKRPLRYVFSFFGLVDILSILPTYLSLYFVGAQHLLIIRILRILRVFRILKLVRYSSEAEMLTNALANSRHKIFVFFFFIVTVLVLFGSVMYVIEGPEHGFQNIPSGIYWAVVTLTTVGYGDIAPQTVLGRMMASIIMLVGYSIIAVPTGIFASEFNKEFNKEPNLNDENVEPRLCEICKTSNHTEKAFYCHHCGSEL